MAESVGQSFKSWTNRNLFTTSFDNAPPPLSMVVPFDGDQQDATIVASDIDSYYQQESGPKNDGGGGIDEHGACIDGKKITAYEAAWNVTNAIQGMFIVGLPQAVKVGGWWTIVALTGIAWICYYTGMALVDCLYDADGRRTRGSYREIAESCWRHGGRIVLAAQICELLMTCILYVVLSGDLLEGSFPSIDKSAWMMLVAAVLLPCAFLTDLTAVSRLSFWNTVSHLVVNAIVLMYCLAQMSRWAWGSVTLSINIRTMPTQIGVVVFGYTSHIFLPTLEGSMCDRAEFQPMLKWTHIAAALFKSAFGLIGFVTFAENTQDEISNSLANENFKILVNMVLLVKALLSYPLPYFATVQLMRDNYFRGTDRTAFAGCFGADGKLREWALSLRICLVLCILFTALSVPYFVLLMGLIGNITGTMLSFVWPCIFHLQLKGAQLPQSKRITDMCIIGVGVLIGAVGIYYSSAQLIAAFNQIDEYE